MRLMRSGVVKVGRRFVVAYSRKKSQRSFWRTWWKPRRNLNQSSQSSSWKSVPRAHRTGLEFLWTTATIIMTKFRVVIPSLFG